MQSGIPRHPSLRHVAGAVMVNHLSRGALLIPNHVVATSSH